MKDCIEIPIFNDEYKVVVTWGDESRWRRVARAYHHVVSRRDDILEGCRGVTLETRGSYPLIVLPRFPKTPEEISTLAHEAVHAIEHIFRHIGADVGGEVFADAVGAVVRIVLRAKPTKRKKR